MKLSLGPSLYFWTADKLQSFYDEVSKSSVDVVYLGETVCSKRRSLNFDGWMELAQGLASQGKQVVLSTLALIEAESELKTLRRFCDNGEFLVEANDMAAVQLLTQNKLPFVTGPTINVYNAQTLAVLQRQGLQRWVMPVELSAQTLNEILSDLDDLGLGDKIETEVFAYGHMPLALSARCFTARAHNRPKDECELVCIDFPAGMKVDTQEELGDMDGTNGHSLFTLNGIQTLSGQPYDLFEQLAQMQEMGIELVRLSPQAENMGVVISSYAAKLNDANASAQYQLSDNCNGYWFGQAGMNGFESA